LFNPKHNQEATKLKDDIKNNKLQQQLSMSSISILQQELLSLRQQLCKLKQEKLQTIEQLQKQNEELTIRNQELSQTVELFSKHINLDEEILSSGNSIGGTQKTERVDELERKLVQVFLELKEAKDMNI